MQIRRVIGRNEKKTEQKAFIATEIKEDLLYITSQIGKSEIFDFNISEYQSEEWQIKYNWKVSWKKGFHTRFRIRGDAEWIKIYRRRWKVAAASWAWRRSVTQCVDASDVVNKTKYLNLVLVWWLVGHHIRKALGRSYCDMVRVNVLFDLLDFHYIRKWMSLICFLLTEDNTIVSAFLSVRWATALETTKAGRFLL